MSDRYFLFIGRWSPFHEGHKYIVDSFVNNGKKVCVAVRDSEEKYPTEVRKKMIEAVYKDNPNVEIIIIPDIEGVCVGRKVGYCLIEAPDEIKKISGTGIRAGTCDAIPDEVQRVIDKWEQENA